MRQGNALLEVYSETLNCQAYAEFPAILEVDQSLDIKYTKLWINTISCALLRDMNCLEICLRRIFTRYLTTKSLSLPFDIRLLYGSFASPDDQLDCYLETNYPKGNFWYFLNITMCESKSFIIKIREYRVLFYEVSKLYIKWYCKHFYGGGRSRYFGV